MKRFYERTKRLAQWVVLAALLFMLPFTASAQTTRHCYAYGNNIHYVAYGDDIQFQEYDNGAYDVDYTGYTVLKGWFGPETTKLAGNTNTFYGPTGYYTFKKFTRDGENYIEVLPMRDRSSVDPTNYKGPNDTDYYNQYFQDQENTFYDQYNTSNGTGAIWVSGGTNFGFPNANWSPVGWTGGDAARWGDNTTAMFRSGDKTYTISIETGRQMTNSGAFGLKFYHSPEYEIYKDNGWRKYFEFRKYTKDDALVSGDTKTTIAFRNYNVVDYLQITTGNNDNPSYGEGNVMTIGVGPYSEIVNEGKLPDGYTFKFTIDLTDLSGQDKDNASWSFTHVPLGVEEIGVPYGDVPAVRTDGTGKIEVNLNHGGNDKKIWLRDALRFDAGVLYANSYDADNYQNVFVFDELVITGILNQTDMEYLTWLARHDRIKKLDLSQAVLPNNTIPSDFAHSDYVLDGTQMGTGASNQNLTEVIFPEALQNIQQNAFQNCQNLETVTFTSSATNLQTVGPQAFRSCPKIQTIDMSRANGLTTIGGSAFTDCTSLATFDISAASKGQVTVGDNAFRSCTALSADQINAIIYRTNGTIDDRTYQNCTASSFKALVITDNITNIKEYAFAGDTQLTEVHVPDANTIPSSTYANSWEGVVPNHCEVVFEGENNYRQYRQEAQNGWMYLLTKDIYENNSSSIDETKNYDVCDQQHADVRLHREFTGSWESLVLPFDVKAGDVNDNTNIDGTVRGKGGAIGYAAILFSATKNHLDFLNVGTHNTKSKEGYGSAEYKIDAGTPFIVHGASGSEVTFVDVETSSDAAPGSVTCGVWTFNGTFDAIPQSPVPASGVFALSGGSIQQATRTAKFKGYRGWFVKSGESFPASSAGSGAKAVTLSFNADDVADSTTGIDRLIEDGTIETTDAAYTLSGIRTTKMGKGIYIINGKKVVIK